MHNSNNCFAVANPPRKPIVPLASPLCENLRLVSSCLASAVQLPNFSNSYGNTKCPAMKPDESKALQFVGNNPLTLLKMTL